MLRPAKAFCFVLFISLPMNLAHAELIPPLPVKKPAPLPVKKSAIKTKTKVVEDKLKLKDELTPLNDIKLSNGDKSTLKKAIKAAFKSDAAKANKLMKSLKSEAAKKIVHWYMLRNPSIKHSTKELTEFLKHNPGWPSRSRLYKKIEQNILNANMKSAEIHDHFTAHKPRTLAGQIAYGEAEIKLGNTDKGKDIIRAAWTSPKLPRNLEKYLVKNHAETLRPLDHEIRVDKLLYLDRRSKIKSAFRVTKYLPKESKKAATFRASVIRRRSGTARSLFSKLSKEAKKRPGVHLARVQLARRTKKHKRAWKLLAETKYKPEQIHDKDEWWIERRVNARLAINENKYETAYKIASNHENPSVNYYNQAEFLSGWIALRFLSQPEQAETHFLNFRKSADGPRTKSKSAYWLGRTYLVLKDEEKAKTYFNEGAAFFNTFYGQLSQQAIEKSPKDLSITPPPTSNPDIIKRFTSRSEIETIVLAHKAELNSIVKLFFAHLRYHLVEPTELAMLAELAASLGYNQSTVRIGKTAMSQNYPLAHYAYPTRFIPPFKPLRELTEKAVIYSIARQESEFNEKIVSRAGARGLMQVMPRTLKYIARQYKIKSRTSWLTKRPAFNAQVGSAYISDRQDEFGGSYIMAFAGFNAGPGRVRQWTKKFGDPRSSDIDPIDWIERIPFTETRNYVQKVMANVQVYRARLGDGKSALKIYQDLNRGKF